MQFDFTSKTTWALVVTAICGGLAFLGINITDDQRSALVSGALDAAQAATVIGPIVAAIYHQISKKRAQTALVATGMSHADAKAVTKS
jgi:hypothetical protein